MIKKEATIDNGMNGNSDLLGAVLLRNILSLSIHSNPGCSVNELGMFPYKATAHITNTIIVYSFCCIIFS